MKTIRSFKAFFLFLIALAAFDYQVNAQAEDITPGMGPGLPTEGYVVLSNGDTISGKLRWTLKYVENNPVEIKFIAENGATKQLKASDIQGFGFVKKVWMENNPVPLVVGFDDYVSLPSYKKGEPVFMNRLLAGRITIYQNRSAIIIGSSAVEEKTSIDGIGFSWIPGEGLTIGPSYRTDYRIIEGRTHFTSYYVSKDGAKYIKIDKDNFDESFSTLFGDCPAINEELTKNPDLRKFKRFMILAEVYNQVCR